MKVLAVIGIIAVFVISIFIWYHVPTQNGNSLTHVNNTLGVGDKNASSSVSSGAASTAPLPQSPDNTAGLFCNHVVPATLPSHFGAMVSLNFDDGYLSTYDIAIPILDKAHLKSTQYIITGAFNKKGYVSQSQVLEMCREGHEIGAHTRTHPHLDTLSDAAARSEIFGSRTDLQSMGINPLTFAYPYGAFSTSTVEIVKAAGFLGARSTRPGFNMPTTDRFVLERRGVENATTFSEVQGWIDGAVKSKSWLILVFHREDEPDNSISISHELLQQIVDYLVSHRLPVVTTAEGLYLMNH